MSSRVLLSMIPLLFSSACTNTTDSSDATLTIALTDAASDELASFVVDVTAIELTRSGGATVGVLPSPVTVDLVSLSELSQVLNVSSVAPGFYTMANITFDFSGAEAYLFDQTMPATLVDGDGNPLTGTLSLPITTGNHLEAIGGRNRLLELDFDLDQSVLVDGGSNTIMVEPRVVVRVDPAAPRELLFGGALAGVDGVAGSISFELQTLGQQPVADLVVGTHPSAIFQVDGVPSTGAAGLTALGSKAPGTWIQCYGVVDGLTQGLTALYIEAGTGTYNGGSDIVDGLVVARAGGAGSDATLTVLGHSNDASHTSFLFNTHFTVDTAFLGTQVLQRGMPTACTLNDVNVGQAVRIFGTLSGTNLDATAGVLRLRPTRVLGFCNGPASSGTLAIDLVRVELRDQSEFTWGDSGTTPPDPALFSSAVAGLASGLGLEAGTAVEIHGFFGPVDDDAEDFRAVTVINRDTAPSLLLVNDLLGGQTLATTATATEISMTVSGSAVPFEVALVDRGFVGALPLPASPTPTVVPAGALGIYLLFDRVTGTGSLHLSFPAFTQALSDLVGQGAHVRAIAAVGQYDAVANATSAGLIGVTLD